MNIHFSRHAKRQMKWRGISEQEVKDAFLSSDKVEDSINSRKNAFKHAGKKLLKVTDDGIIIVTVIDRNK